jgi:hypothetical protein
MALIVWLQISNQGGYLVLEYDGPDAGEKAKDMISYFISDDVVTTYDGNIAGRVA